MRENFTATGTRQTVDNAFGETQDATIARRLACKRARKLAING